MDKNFLPRTLVLTHKNGVKESDTVKNFIKNMNDWDSPFYGDDAVNITLALRGGRTTGNFSDGTWELK